MVMGINEALDRAKAEIDSLWDYIWEQVWEAKDKEEINNKIDSFIMALKAMKKERS